ncbi:hypothetical protein CRG98_027669 [Punica granatum]|uniref:Uncharacterized protein n=1 Tax=Punica granatum TaxID=22663 RepID=A0A2I0J707_PUNGR|nr:hypothetical protein CRG98_027669 [Punica granatum]
MRWVKVYSSGVVSRDELVGLDAPLGPTEAQQCRPTSDFHKPTGPGAVGERIFRSGRPVQMIFTMDRLWNSLRDHAYLRQKKKKKPTSRKATCLAGSCSVDCGKGVKRIVASVHLSARLVCAAILTLTQCQLTV